MSNASSRFASIRPIRPMPRIPARLPENRLPDAAWPPAAHLPARTHRSPDVTLRAASIASTTAVSATSS
jgi:hypothetical protein